MNKEIQARKNRDTVRLSKMRERIKEEINLTIQEIGKDIDIERTKIEIIEKNARSD